MTRISGCNSLDDGRSLAMVKLDKNIFIDWEQNEASHYGEVAPNDEALVWEVASEAMEAATS